MTSFAPRGLAASLAVAAVLGLGLTGCDDGSSAAVATDQGSSSDVPGSAPLTSSPSAAAETEAAPETEPESETETEAAPEAESESESESEVDPSSFNDPSHPYEYDEEVRTDFPGAEAVFDDTGSAGSDGRTFWVTTPAEEYFSLELPTEAEGWITGARTIDLGDAGWGYLVTQSAGEYLETNLVVLDAGDFYIAQKSDEVPFGDSVGEGGGPEFSTHTTDGGRHLVTAFDDGTTYEWSVVDGELVPTEV